jgi:MFS family permease
MDAETKPDTGTFRGRLLLIGIGVTLFAIGQSLLFTIVSPLARRIGLSEIQFGAILTFASLPLVFGAPYWGKKSDTIGRKPVFVLGLLGSGLGTLLVALALQFRLNGWFSVPQLVGGLLVARALYSLATSAVYPAAGGYIADVTDFRTRGQGMAVLGASNSLGAIIGPGMAATFALAFTNELIAMYVAAVLMGLGSLAAVFMLKEPAKHHAIRPDGAVTLKPFDARLRPFMIIWCAFFLTFASVQITTAFLIQDRFHLNEYHDIVRVTTFCLISMATVITLVQGVVFQMIRITPQTALRLCGPAFCMSLLTMLLAPQPWVLIVGFALLGLAFSCATPGINGGASLMMAPHEQGAASGYLSAANTVGAILGPLVGTSLYRANHLGVLAGGTVLFAIVSIYALTVHIPQRNPALTP